MDRVLVGQLLGDFPRRFGLGGWARGTLMSLMLVGPIFAPSMGGLLASYAGWRPWIPNLIKRAIHPVLSHASVENWKRAKEIPYVRREPKEISHQKSWSPHLDLFSNCALKQTNTAPSFLLVFLFEVIKLHPVSCLLGLLRATFEPQAPVADDVGDAGDASC